MALAKTAANALVRIVLRFPLLERLLVAATRQPLLRRHLRLGAIALGYPGVLKRRELRLAEMGTYRFYVNVGDYLGVESYFFGNSGTLWFTRSLLRGGDLCIDAGANVGHYTFFCASAVGPSGSVFAFEPNPEFYLLLNRSIVANDYSKIVEVSPYALWANTGETKLFYLSDEPTNPGTSSIINHGLFLSQDHTIEVETVSLDDFVRTRDLKQIRLFKIDVERAENWVLEGARQTVANHRIDYIILEMYSGRSTEKLLDAAGYRGYLVVQGALQLTPLSLVENNVFGDYLFIRPGLGELETI